MDRNELLEIHKEICEKSREIMDRKNQDYATDTSTPFLNFEAAESLGITSTEQGILVRLTDKIRRIITFTKKGNLKVKDEPLKDAIIDSINYLIIFYAYIQRGKE